MSILSESEKSYDIGNKEDYLSENDISQESGDKKKDKIGTLKKDSTYIEMTELR